MCYFFMRRCKALRKENEINLVHFLEQLMELAYERQICRDLLSPP
jgi:hypothetical protein